MWTARSVLLKPNSRLWKKMRTRTSATVCWLPPLPCHLKLCWGQQPWSNRQDARSNPTGDLARHSDDIARGSYGALALPCNGLHHSGMVAKHPLKNRLNDVTGKIFAIGSASVISPGYTSCWTGISFINRTPVGWQVPQMEYLSSFDLASPLSLDRHCTIIWKLWACIICEGLVAPSCFV